MDKGINITLERHVLLMVEIDATNNVHCFEMIGSGLVVLSDLCQVRSLTTNSRLQLLTLVDGTKEDESHGIMGENGMNVFNVIAESFCGCIRW